MSVAELYELLYAMIAALDQIVEFWLTATFAVVVSAHFLEGRLARTTGVLLAVAYSLMSAFLAMRIAVVGTKMTETIGRLEAAGEMMPIDLLRGTRLLMLVTGVFGYCAVLYFLRRASLGGSKISGAQGNESDA